jgi:hypothetical protein
MKPKTKILVYLLLLAALAGYFAGYELFYKKGKEAREEREKKAWNLEKSKVTSIVLAKKGQDPIEISLKDKNWMILKPVQTKADAFQAGELLNALAGLEKIKTLEKVSLSDPVFGLNPGVLEITLREGGNSRTLVLGEPSPVGEGRYARVNGTGPVILIPSWQASVLMSDLFALREKTRPEASKE